jgi:hypothetical protein
MYAKNVTIKYMGVKFVVNVPCTPDTEESELKLRAIRILEDTFSRNGIRIVE